MSVTRDELPHLVDQLPEERLAPVLELIRGDAATGRKTKAAATLERVQERMHGVTGIDEELQRLRDEGRGGRVLGRHRRVLSLVRRSGWVRARPGTSAQAGRSWVPPGSEAAMTFLPDCLSLAS